MTTMAGFISMPGGSEWLIIFIVILILFGPKNLPKIGKAIGRGIREFKEASDGLTRAIEEEAAAVEREEEERKRREAASASSDSDSSPELDPSDGTELSAEGTSPADSDSTSQPQPPSD